jgi:L-amino acid N-acyltransferase YncA
MGPHEHIVRDALREDCGAIAAIYNEGITEGRSTFETEPRTAADISGWLGSPRHPVLIAEHDGKVAGWARLAPYSTRPCYGGIGEASIYVRASARGRGLGNALAGALRERAEQAALTKLLAEVNADLAEPVSSDELGRCQICRETFPHGQIDGRWHDVLLVELLLEQQVVSAIHPQSPPPGRHADLNSINAD